MTSVFDESINFDEVDSAREVSAFGVYLNRMAADLSALKQALHDAVEVRPGYRILDVGCGTGADVRTLARRGGRVMGIDSSTHLVELARAHEDNGDLPVEFEVGDAHELPFPDGSFDITRSERVMMHVTDPTRAIRELVRVTRPGGQVLVADPDHGMWALDAPDPDLTRTLLAWWFDFITNPWIARQMPARFEDASLRDVHPFVRPILLPTLEAADAMTGLTKMATTAAQQGLITAEQRDRFDAELADRAAGGRFFMCGAVIATLGRVPA